MGLQLPGGLVTVMGLVGYTWPRADEEKLFDQGREWLALGGRISGMTQPATEQAAQVWVRGKGADVTAFREEFQGEQGPPTQMRDTAQAAMLIGTGMIIAMELLHRAGRRLGLSPRTFRVKDSRNSRYIVQTANAIERRFPGRVLRVERLVHERGGRDPGTDFDIETRNAVIQVKAGQARGLSEQMERTMQYTRKPVYGYAPDTPAGKIAQRRARGLMVTKSLDELLDWLARA